MMLKKKMWKTVIAFLLSSAMVLLAPIASMAAITDWSVSQQSEIVTPRLTYISDAEATLSIDGTIATVDCWVNGHVLDATKAKVIAELQVKSGNNWIAYGTWVDTQNDYEAYVYETKAVKKGNTYRVKATFTVWEGSASEELILFTDEKTA